MGMNRARVAALWLAGLLVLAALVGVISPAELGAVLRQVDAGLLAWATLLSAIATLLGAANSYLFVSIDHPVGLRPWLGYFWLAWAVGLVLPGQVGDVGMLSWLMKRRGMRWTHSLGRLFLDKLLSLVVMAALAAWGLLDLLDRLDLVQGQLLFVASALAVAALLLALLYRLPGARRFLQHGIDVLGEAAAVARAHPWRVLLNVLLTLAKVLVLALSFWYVCKAAGFEALSFALLLRLMAVSSLVAYLPLSMNGVGTVEVTAVALFPVYGFEPAVVLAAYLLARVMTLALAWLPALAGLALVAARR